MRILLIALLAAISYAQTDEPEERDLTEEELADIYRHVTNALREQGLHEAAESAAREWEEIQSASSADRRRRLSSSSKGGKRKACEEAVRYELCVEKFDEIVKYMIEHEGNAATEICQKPSNKLQRSPLSLCERTQSVRNCCGCTLASDNWCYADHGTCRTISGRDVCPPNKWTCSRWGTGRYCAASTSACRGEIESARLDIADIVRNMLSMVFTGGASTAIYVAVHTAKRLLKTASKSMARQTLMTTLKTVLKNAGQSYMWRSLKNHMKNHFNLIPEELGNYIMEEAMAITSAQSAVAESGADSLAWNIEDIVDLAGVTTFLHYLVEGQEECKYPEGPTDKDQADAISARGANYEGSCGRTPHGTRESRRRFESFQSSSCDAETQYRTCQHGSFTGWSGSYSSTICRTETRQTTSTRCLSGADRICPDGWVEYSRTEDGCCWWIFTCDQRLLCERYVYGAYQHSRPYAADSEKALADKAQPMIAAKEETEQKSMAQSVISEKSSASDVAVMGFAFIGLASIFSFAFKRVVTEEYKKIEPQI